MRKLVDKERQVGSIRSVIVMVAAFLSDTLTLVCNHVRYLAAKREINLKNFTVRLRVGLITFCLFAGCVTKVSARLIHLDDQRGTDNRFQQDEVFDSFAQAFRAPEKVRRLVLKIEDPEMRHLSARLGSLVNLEVLEFSCLEKLEDLPIEIGKLQKLEELIIDNGNGCQMNVQILC